MVSGTLNTARNVVGIIGNIIALCLFLSPVPTFVRICKKRSVEEFSPVPYLASLLNCMFWVLYGLPMVKPNSILVITINGAGTAIEIVYVVLFLVFCRDRKKRLAVAAVVLLELVVVGLVAALVLALLHTTQKRTLVVGIICIVFNIIMYASPLSVMKLVITTKSVEYMPFYLSLAACVNGVAWFAYAFMPFDLFIALPNGIGSLFGLAQLIMYGAYYKSTKRITAERQRQRANGEVGLSEVVSTEPKKTHPNGTHQRNGP